MARGNRDNNRGGGQSPSARRAPPQIKLPTKTTAVSTTLASRIQLWLGGPKVGKTVQANSVPGGALFLAFEPGHDHIDCYQLPINSWDEMLGSCNELMKAKKSGADMPYSTIVIDTASEAFERCREYVLRMQGIEHEQDLAYGKGTGLVRDEFRRVITKLCNLGFGIIFIAHIDTHTKKRKQGKDYVEFQIEKPRLSKAAAEIIPPMADLILYFVKEWDDEDQRWRRVIRTTGTDWFQAGVRYPPNWTVGLPEVLPMSYAKLVEAWEAGEASAKKKRRRQPKKSAPKDAAPPPEDQPQGDDQDKPMDWTPGDEDETPPQTQPKPRGRKTGTKLKD